MGGLIVVMRTSTQGSEGLRYLYNYKATPCCCSMRYEQRSLHRAAYRRAGRLRLLTIVRGVFVDHLSGLGPCSKESLQQDVGDRQFQERSYILYRAMGGELRKGVSRMLRVIDQPFLVGDDFEGGIASGRI